MHGRPPRACPQPRLPLLEMHASVHLGAILLIGPFLRLNTGNSGGFRGTLRPRQAEGGARAAAQPPRMAILHVPPPLVAPAHRTPRAVSKARAAPLFLPHCAPQGGSLVRGLALDLPPVSWADVGGLGDVKHQLRRAVEWPLTRADDMAFLGLRPPRGILLHGVGRPHITFSRIVPFGESEVVVCDGGGAPVAGSDRLCRVVWVARRGARMLEDPPGARGCDRRQGDAHSALRARENTAAHLLLLPA